MRVSKLNGKFSFFFRWTIPHISFTVTSIFHSNAQFSTCYSASQLIVSSFYYYCFFFFRSYRYILDVCMWVSPACRWCVVFWNLPALCLSLLVSARTVTLNITVCTNKLKTLRFLVCLVLIVVQVSLSFMYAHVCEKFGPQTRTCTVTHLCCCR